MAKSATQRERNFARAFASNPVKKSALLEAGYSKNIGQSAADRMLRKPAVRALIARYRNEAEVQAQYSSVRWLRDQVSLATSDVRNLFDPETGRMLKPWEWDDATAASVKSIEVVEINDGEGNHIGDKKKVTFWDKNKALESIGKHLGVYEADNTQRNNYFDFSNVSTDQLREFVNGEKKTGQLIEGTLVDERESK